MRVYVLHICVFLIFAYLSPFIYGQDVIPAFNDVENVSLSSHEVVENVADHLEPSIEVKEKVENSEGGFQSVFFESTSQNSGVANDVSSNGGLPVVITLPDIATAELTPKAVISSDNTLQPSLNETQRIDTLYAALNESHTSESININQTEEDIPSFSEWTQKQLEEAEKNKSTSNASSTSSNGKQTKLRWKNYASLDCGAKVVATNPEAVSPSAILSPSRDEYQLNPCTGRIWFIVELCEAIQAKKIDVANFELFSSSPKDFIVSVSDRFPTRDWANVGQFVALDERDVQSFDLHPHLFGKYIKVEVRSHYGSEHYCPISLFRVYGTSEFEVLQTEESVNSDHDDDDDDDDSLDSPDGAQSKNLLSSATDAVISMVKKAAQVLGNKSNISNLTDMANPSIVVPLVKMCTCPSHLVVCDNCSDALFGRIYELLSCDDSKIKSLVNVSLFRRILTTSDICNRFGFDLTKTNVSRFGSNYLLAILPEYFIGAMCNMMAVFQNRVVLNVSSNFINETKTMTADDEIIELQTSEPHVILTKENQVSHTNSFDINNETDVKSSFSTEVTTDSSLIKPTKTDDHLVDTLTDDSIRNTIVSSQIVQNNYEQTEAVTVESETMTEESIETIEEHLEGLLEFNDSHTIPIHTTSSTTPQTQKESVFLRLSNRIKSLERNMSLSGQYLEELSKRYKKQVEEIQKMLDKTILNMNEDNAKKDELNKQLEERLNQLTQTVEILIAERRSWLSTIYCIVVSSLVTFFIVNFCCKIPEPLQINRKKSIELPKKRRASDIVRVPTDQPDNSRKKKRKKSLLKRSNSIGAAINVDDTAVWVGQTADVVEDWVEGKHLEDVPFVLEESEHSSLEPVTLQKVPDYVKTAVNSRLLRVGDFRKSVSLDESQQQIVTNGGTIKEKRKGLKRIFKKVF